MPRFNFFFRCLAETIVAKGLKALAGLVPFGESLYQIAEGVLTRYRAQGKIDEISDDLAATAQASAAEIRHEAEQAVQEVAGTQPVSVQQSLVDYLNMVPTAIRQSLKRPEDHSGTSVPTKLTIIRPEQLLPLLPNRPTRFRPGDRPTPGGAWVLLELLGIGGFGEVWKAQHPQFAGITAALKFCLDPNAAKVLRHEATLLNQVMRHTALPGIVPLRQAYLDSEPPCLEYEFVPGGDLGNLVRNWPTLPADQRIRFANRLLHRLAAIVAQLHRLQPAIVHRDLKPANILIQRHDEEDLDLRVTDFGIGGIAAGQALGAAHLGHTTRGELLALSMRGAHTPLYASPQQVQGQAPDPRDDVYSLGVIWYQLLTANPGQGISGDFADDLREIGLAEPLIALLGKCVAGKVERRPTDAGVLAELLQEQALTPAAFANNGPKPVPVKKSPPPSRPASPPSPPPTLRDPGTPFTNQLGIKFAWIPPGTFLMGSPSAETGRMVVEIPHQVTLTRGFFLGIFPVTQLQWHTVMGNDPSHFKGDELPVEMVSWDDCQEFCKLLSKQDGLPYRLPTEAEWEYACRAGATTAYYFGFSPNHLGEYAWFFDNSNSQTQPVGQKKPNAWGLYDMHGLVWEWCQDWYGSYGHKKVEDPTGPKTGNAHVLRGGSWGHRDLNCRSAFRSRRASSAASNIVGFRVAFNPS